MSISNKRKYHLIEQETFASQPFYKSMTLSHSMQSSPSSSHSHSQSLSHRYLNNNELYELISQQQYAINTLIKRIEALEKMCNNSINNPLSADYPSYIN